MGNAECVIDPFTPRSVNILLNAFQSGARLSHLFPIRARGELGYFQLSTHGQQQSDHGHSIISVQLIVANGKSIFWNHLPSRTELR